MLDWLRGHGVDDVLLSCGFMGGGVEEVLGREYEGMALHYVNEKEKLDTAGPVRLAYDMGLLQERLFVLNGDCLTDLDLSAELEHHERTGAVLTLALMAVEDTSSYGVVPIKEDGEVEAFLEKQDGPVPTNRINAGAYTLERSVVEDHIPAGRAVSFEREVFPALVGKGLFGYPAEGYWIDIGTPERYLEATYDLLAGRVESTLPPRDETGSLVGAGSIVSGAAIGPQSVLGTRCLVGAGAEVARSVLHDGVRVGDDASIQEAILAEGVHVGPGAEVLRGAVIGRDARIAAEVTVSEDARVQPEQEVG
jgi:mannose-1-phosphate guanylyltransferase